MKHINADRHFGELEGKRGIYVITNTANGKKYVGTGSSFRCRWLTHLRLFQRGLHRNLAMQADWNTYGDNAFTFEAVEVVDSDYGNTVHKRERHWIERLREEGFELYNITDAGRLAWEARRRNGTTHPGPRQRKHIKQ